MKKRALMIVFLFSAATNGMEDRKETKFLIVHHSATEIGNADVIRKYHKEVNGWDENGYHYMITNGNGGPDGEIQIGRPENKVGAHAKGRNHNSIGICLIGTDKFTEKQEASLVKLLHALCVKYNLKIRDALHGHHENCPGPGLNLK